MTKNLSTIVFLVGLFAFSGFSSKLKEETEISTTSDSLLYQSLVQFSVPTVSTYNCSALQSMIDLYNVGYSEIGGLSAYSCIKAIFDQNVAKLQSMIDNAQCKQDIKPVSTVVEGETMIWVLGYYTATWFYSSPDVEHQDMGIQLKFIDRIPNKIGGLVWAINTVKGVVFRNGTVGAWTSRPGITAKYLRINPYDLRVWATDTSNYVYSISQTETTWTKENSGIQLIYLDVSKKNGQVYGIKADFTLWVTKGANNGWTQIPGYSVKFLRVISNGNIFAIASTDGSVIFKSSDSAPWQVLSGQTGFNFIDVNNQGMIYGIKSDNSVWNRNYVDGTWVSEGKTFSTLRVLDDGSMYGVGVKDYDGANGKLYYKNSYGTYKQMADWAFTLWGPTNCNVWF